MGDCNVIQAIKDCCCTTQKSILEMGYQNQIQNLQQTNTLQQGMNYIATGMERGFSNLGFQGQQQTCQIVQAINAASQRQIDVMNAHWTEDLRDKLFAASQREQTASIVAQLKSTTTPTTTA